MQFERPLIFLKKVSSTALTVASIPEQKHHVFPTIWFHHQANSLQAAIVNCSLKAPGFILLPCDPTAFDNGTVCKLSPTQIQANSPRYYAITSGGFVWGKKQVHEAL